MKSTAAPVLPAACAAAWARKGSGAAARLVLTVRADFKNDLN